MQNGEPNGVYYFFDGTLKKTIFSFDWLVELGDSVSKRITRIACKAGKRAISRAIDPHFATKDI